MDKPVFKIHKGKRVNLAPFGRNFEVKIGEKVFVYKSVDRTHCRLLEVR